MKITRDDPKRIANLEKHGLDFAALSLEFFLNSVVIQAKKNRFQAIGKMQDGTISVIFGTLGSEGISVISMRRANSKERNLL
jgi:uncharacterized DUF497 family protein